MDKKIPPIGPLAIVLRRLGTGNRTIVIIAATICAALLIGIVLLAV